MPQSHRMRRARLTAMAGFLGASAAVAGFAVPAGAATVPAQNHIIIGGGSNTTYSVMMDLSKIFNESPGCDLVSPGGSTQNLDYRCPTPQNGTGGENGLGDGSGYTNTGSLAQGDPENPYNDVVVEEPALGSGNGIKELDQRGTNNAPLDFARSSRGPNNGLPAPTGDSGRHDGLGPAGPQLRGLCGRRRAVAALDEGERGDYSELGDHLPVASRSSRCLQRHDHQVECPVPDDSEEGRQEVHEGRRDRADRRLHGAERLRYRGHVAK